MNMVGQDANRDGFEWSILLHRRVDAAQSIDVPNQQVTRSVGESDREKEDSTFDVGTSVTRHWSANSGHVGTARESAPLPTLHQAQSLAMWVDFA